jgi:hypothetical protein
VRWEMKKNPGYKLINFLKLYLITSGILLMLGIVLGFGTTIVSFIKDEKLTHDHFTFAKISLINPPQGIIINPFIDGLMTILIGLIISISIIAIIYYLLKFVKNLIVSEILIKENGKYLRMCGIILSMATTLYLAQDVFLNINMFNPIANSVGATKVILVFLMIVFSAVMHPMFWLGMFFILSGKILDMASDVKQENDLTV